MIDNDTDDEWYETTEQPSGVMDTLLQEPNITQDGDRIISFAPGEGNRPLGILMDKDSEYLSVLTIYCGKRQADNNERFVPVHGTMCVWELRSKDRRVAQSVKKPIQGSASLSLRNCKTKGKTFTVGNLKSESSVNKLIHLAEGFQVLRNLYGRRHILKDAKHNHDSFHKSTNEKVEIKAIDSCTRRFVS